MDFIYLDHAATTPVHPKVKEAMLPYLDDFFGNPSSTHAFGRQTRLALDQARDQVAAGIHAKPAQITFTSGGTEADNMAIIGAALANKQRGNHIITAATEHHAVLHTCEYLQHNGYEVTFLPVDTTGRIEPDAVRAAITDHTILITIMYVNNEVGTIQPIEEIGAIAQEHGVLFHTDAVQALGIIDIDVTRLPVDMISMSAHKINGPKGIGALYAADHVKLSPLTFGGSQERNRRSGTENIAGIVGFGQAMQSVSGYTREAWDHYSMLRQLMLETFSSSLNQGDYVVNGHPEQVSPRILNISFPGTDTPVLLMNLDLEGVAAASGSACNSGTHEISHVLENMNLPPEVARSAVRFSFGYGTTEEQVVSAANTTIRILQRIRRK